MNRQIHILILEDNASDLELIKRELRKVEANCVVEWAQDKESFLQILNSHPPELVLLDYSVPGFDGLSALVLARQRFPGVPAIIVSGAIGEETAIETLKAGATDYVLKQRLSRLGPVIDRALQEAEQLAHRMAAEQEIQRQREWFRAILGSIGDAVIACDTSGRITFLNPAVSSLTGWKHDEAMDRPIQSMFRIVNEKTQEPAEDIIAQVLDKKRALASANHIALLTKDGRMVPIADSAAPILDTNGNIMGVVVVFHDVTEKRRSQKALQDAKEHLEIRVKERTAELEYANHTLQEEITEHQKAKIELETYREHLEDLVRERTRELEAAYYNLREADRYKNQFMAVLSHELRNPLASIQNSLHIMDRAAPGGDQARRAKTVIDRQAGQLARLVDDMLDVTRITQNKIRLQRERIELNELVRQALDDHRALFEQHGVRLEAEFSDSPLFVKADNARLTQVIGNLLQNAVKFTHRDGKVTIFVAGEAGGRAVIRVADTGIGIRPEVLPRLFQPFMQAETTLDRSRGGLGLGLALSKGLVELHGGDINVHSDGEGKGTEFQVRLPLDETMTKEPQSVVAEVSSPSRRVLIIEDNVDLAESSRILLELDGHQVEVAYSGPEGFSKALEFHPEVLLCDIGMPGMDGYAVARAFRADERLKKVFLIALTGYAQPEDLKEAAEAGFDRHLAKPPMQEALVRTLANVPDKSFDGV